MGINKKRVLIVDDDEKNLKLLRIVLRNAGYETIEAENGEQGVKLARESRPSPIFMDMRMPVMDGITATKILKADESTKTIPIIVITASAMKGDREKIAKEAGCDGYVAKPIDVKSFMNIVGKYLEDG